MLPWNEDGKLEDFIAIINPDREEPPDLNSLNWARERLILWKLKSDQTCLPEIETTLAVISSLFQDRVYQQKLAEGCNISIESYDSCTHYAMAIVKFCNLLPYYKCDQDSNEITRLSKKVKKSVRDLGIELNLPTWVLECRHKICHTSNNSLILLRQANFFVLSWTYKNFWTKLLANIYTKAPNIRGAIHCDIEALFETPGSKGRKRIFIRLEESFQNHREEFCKIIAHFVIEDSCRRFPTMKLRNYESSKEILTFYSRVFRLITSRDDFDLVITTLSSYLEFDDDKLSFVIQWFKIFMKALAGKKENRWARKCLKLPMLITDSDESNILWLRMLYLVATRPNRFTGELIEYIYSLEPSIMPREHVDKLKKASRIFLMPCEEICISQQSSGTSIKTINDLPMFQNCDGHRISSSEDVEPMETAA